MTWSGVGRWYKHCLNLGERHKQLPSGEGRLPGCNDVLQRQDNIDARHRILLHGWDGHRKWHLHVVTTNDQQPYAARRYRSWIGRDPMSKETDLRLVVLEQVTGQKWRLPVRGLRPHKQNLGHLGAVDHLWGDRVDDGDEGGRDDRNCWDL